jgi:hypothetical protein
MQRIPIIILVVFVTIVSCEKKKNSTTSSNNTTQTQNSTTTSGTTTGGTTTGGTTTGGTTTTTPQGKVTLKASWTKSYKSCTYAYTTKIGLGYTSTDVVNEAYFAESGGDVDGSLTYTKDALAPGIYYYQAKKSYNTNCGTGQGIPTTVTKKGSFTVASGSTTVVEIGNLD